MLWRNELQGFTGKFTVAINTAFIIINAIMSAKLALINGTFKEILRSSKSQGSKN